MAEKTRKMNMSAGVSDLDLDSLIADADPLAVKIDNGGPQTKNNDPKASEKPPWKKDGQRGKVSMPLYLAPETKRMIDYLREATGVPSQVLLRKIIEPAIKKEAEKNWKNG